MSNKRHDGTSKPKTFWLRLALMPIIAVVLIATICRWISGPSHPDQFYQSQQPLPSLPGQLIKSEAFIRGVPKDAQSWRILYTTTRSDGSLALASALVVSPRASDGQPMPVISWAHGTTGIVSGCAPSVMKKPFANVPAFPDLLKQGYAFIATDYVGLGTAGGHAYLVGDEAAHAVLDAMRAARQLDSIKFQSSTVVWGHSQGGNTALWTGILASTYAPELDVRAIAALAPASDLMGLVSASRSSAFGKIVSSYLLVSQSAGNTMIAVNGLSGLIAKDIASRCVGEIGTLFSMAETLLLPAAGIFDGDPTQGSLGEMLQANTPNRNLPMPLFIAQGQKDDLVLPAIQNAYVGDRCAAGQALEYHLYENRDHISLVAADSPLTKDLLAWTKLRFSGQLASSNCQQDTR